MGSSIRTLVLGLAVLIIIIILATVVLPGLQGGPGIGPLGAAHTHADFLVIVNGQALDFNQPKYMVRSPFVHVEGDNVGGAGKVIHLHATNVPLSMFFESLKMQLTSECLKLDDGRNYCNTGPEKLRMYVNGQPSGEFGKYRPKDLDRILITYGDYTGEQIQAQLSRVSDLAKRESEG